MPADVDGDRSRLDPQALTQSAQVISDLRHPLARRIADIVKHSHRHQQRSIIVDDEENVLAALQNNVAIESVYSSADQDLPESIVALLPSETPRYQLSTEVAKSLFKAEKRSRLFAIARIKRPATLADIDTSWGDVVVLDGVRLAGNIGAIIRTATAFEAGGVILLNSELTSSYDRRLIRASRGAVFGIPVVVSEPTAFARFLDEADLPMVSMSAHAGAPLSYVQDFRRPIAILLGGEKHGASTEIEELVTERYRINTSPRIESLNVSVAAALALYEHARETL